ncbi:MAG: glycerol kinase GlpK [Lachnospiraceae bacterium]|nr:glycerol kinase GlpK [Lachnospiraceae bacterium]
MAKYILAIDQSTQGTKALIFDEKGRVCDKAYKSHRQIVNDHGWVEHDPREILQNTLEVTCSIVEKSGINSSDVAAIGISNQRETSLAWNKETGAPIYNAIVWQCCRAEEICQRHREAGEEDIIREKSGMQLSPYFPASKLQWIMENVPEARSLAKRENLAVGTIDSWLVYNLTGKKYHKTDYSNASRTQLFNIQELKWDEELCRSFDIPISALPEVCMSDSEFGRTDMEGLFPQAVPIHSVMGDSHAALFGQNCRESGNIKATYGTGSSVMMNIGDKFINSEKGLVTSLAWGINGKVDYVFEGNLNYTGAVISWLKDNVKLITTSSETEELAKAANKQDCTYFVPAFTGLGAPYWNAGAKGILTGITRTTGRNEIVRACVDCIGYQITDLIKIMREESGRVIGELHVDGGPTANGYLMQFQSDMANVKVEIPEIQELSCMGVAYLAGIASGIYDSKNIFDTIKYHKIKPQMSDSRREELYRGWKAAIRQVVS